LFLIRACAFREGNREIDRDVRSDLDPAAYEDVADRRHGQRVCFWRALRELETAVRACARIERGFDERDPRVLDWRVRLCVDDRTFQRRLRSGLGAAALQ